MKSDEKWWFFITFHHFSSLFIFCDFWIPNSFGCQKNEIWMISLVINMFPKTFFLIINIKVFGNKLFWNIYINIYFLKTITNSQKHKYIYKNYKTYFVKIYDIVFLLFCFVNKLKNKIYNYTIIIEKYYILEVLNNVRIWFTYCFGL